MYFQLKVNIKVPHPLGSTYPFTVQGLPGKCGFINQLLNIFMKLVKDELTSRF